MESIPEPTVALDTTNAIARGWLSRELDEQEGRRRAYNRGLKEGAGRVLDSPTLETMALEIVLLRSTIEAMALAAEQQERTIEWYQNKVTELAHHILIRENDK